MALRGSAPRRYARAAFELAHEQGQEDQWLPQLDLAATTLSDPALVAALLDSELPFEQKQGIVDQLLPGLQPLVRNLVYVLIQRQRIDQLPAVRDEFRRLLNEERGIAMAVVTTAVPVDAAEQARIQQELATRTGKQLEIEMRVDPQIIGGLTARIGDTIIDGSTRGRLIALRRRLAGAAR